MDQYLLASLLKPVNLTIVTTMYGDPFKPDHDLLKYRPERMRDPRYIYICHGAAPSLEGDNATSIYWLSPLHSRYIVPTFFPPSLVQRAQSKWLKAAAMKRNPVFLVMGSFNDGRKRNIKSLTQVLKATQHYNYTIRFLGGWANHESNETLNSTLNNTFSAHDLGGAGKKIELVPNSDAYEFMQQVGNVDIILPLVDRTNFYDKKGYIEGKKLTSSISWGLGFGKKFVLYQPLAEVYGIQEDNDSYWFYNDTDNSFLEAFRACLEHFK